MSFKAGDKVTMRNCKLPNRYSLTKYGSRGIVIKSIDTQTVVNFTYITGKGTGSDREFCNVELKPEDEHFTFYIENKYLELLGNPRKPKRTQAKWVIPKRRA